jgi:hypothetical protein
MKPLIKKITAFFLLLVGAMPVFFTLFFLIRQQIIHHEMKEKLEQEMLHTILIPEAEVQWMKYKKEIRFGNKMFDVESFTVKDGQYIFKGLYDDDETALNSYFEKNTHQKNEKGYQVLTTLFQLLQNVYSVNSSETLTSQNISKEYSPLILQHIPSPFINILTPPPQA